MNLWMALQAVVDLLLVCAITCLAVILAKRAKPVREEASIDKKEVDTLVETLFHLMKELEGWSEGIMEEVARRRDEVKQLMEEMNERDRELRGICEETVARAEEVRQKPKKEPAVSGAVPGRYGDVLRLAAEGKDVRAISDLTKMPGDEVRLIFDLHRKVSGGRFQEVSG